jgi:hypothetical protein
LQGTEDLGRTSLVFGDLVENKVDHLLATKLLLGHKGQLVLERQVVWAPLPGPSAPNPIRDPRPTWELNCGHNRIDRTRREECGKLALQSFSLLRQPTLEEPSTLRAVDRVEFAHAIPA